MQLLDIGPSGQPSQKPSAQHCQGFAGFVLIDEKSELEDKPRGQPADYADTLGHWATRYHVRKILQGDMVVILDCFSSEIPLEPVGSN